MGTWVESCAECGDMTVYGHVVCWKHLTKKQRAFERKEFGIDLPEPKKKRRPLRRKK